MRPCREVQGLSAVELASSPWPRTRATGTKALGKAYERKLAKALPWAKAGQWFQFWDANGKGFCSPDLYFLLSRVVVVLEAKLTDTDLGIRQLMSLYLPVLGHYYSRPVKGILVCKNLTRASVLPIHSLDAALATPGIPILHWRPPGPLGATKTKALVKPLDKAGRIGESLRVLDCR